MGGTTFQIVDGIARFVLTGEHSLDEGARLVTAAIERAKAQQIGRLLVDASGADGIAVPTVNGRYTVVTEWAAAARGVVRVGIVLREAFIEPDHFGAVVARNHGFDLRGFTTVPAALTWLQDEAPAA